MSYKIVVNVKRAEKEETIRDTAALTTGKLSNITTSSVYATKILLLLSTAALSHNSLDCSIWSIPVTRVDSELDVLPKDWSTATRSNSPPSKELDKLLCRKRWYDAGVMTG
ncbi:hypothetical protein BDM02DRAFT_3273351 [Thelephora ganbajun]|uniref:Uncharacterized protein n=1 Tax=Thelephora ganbajun TaxID=370292 RepID=A0ACB6YZY4_THEGA|nr:hypothetical protein BDM02DRAFT_3273351 [Thelephora ganbajun]